MKVNTNIRTLKQVYGMFKTAGIGGLLTGEAQEVKAVDVMDKLIAGDLMVQTLKEITGSEAYEADDGSKTPWDEVPYAQVNEVLTSFFAGIGSVSTLARG